MQSRLLVARGQGWGGDGKEDVGRVIQEQLGRSLW